MSEQRREQILDTAETVFAKRGFHETRMDDIVEESGLSKGAIYWYLDRARAAGSFPGIRLPYAHDRRAAALAPVEWAQDLYQLQFRGSRVLAETEFYHPASRTLMMTDFVQHYPPESGSPFRNLFTKLAGVQRAGAPLDIRLSFAGNHAEVRRSLSRLLSWEFDSMIPAHGLCIRTGARSAVENAFAWLH